MDFELSADERDLQEGIRSFLSARHPLSVARANEETGGRLDHALWKSVAEIGVFSLQADGFGLTESVLAFAELGRALVNGPLVATHLAAGLDAPFARGARDGSRIVGFVEPSEPVTVVEHLDSLDALIVIRPGGLYLVDPNSVEAVRAERPLDSLTPVASVVAL